MAWKSSEARLRSVSAALTREAGYTTGSFVACRYHIELCRKFRQMAWKSSKALSLRLSAALTGAGGRNHRHLEALALGSTGNIPTGT